MKVDNLLMIYRPFNGSQHIQLFGGSGYIVFSNIFKTFSEESKEPVVDDHDTSDLPPPIVEETVATVDRLDEEVSVISSDPSLSAADSIDDEHKHNNNINNINNNNNNSKNNNNNNNITTTPVVSALPPIPTKFEPSFEVNLTNQQMQLLMDFSTKDNNSNNNSSNSSNSDVEVSSRRELLVGMKSGILSFAVKFLRDASPSSGAVRPNVMGNNTNTNTNTNCDPNTLSVPSSPNFHLGFMTSLRSIFNNTPRSPSGDHNTFILSLPLSLVCSWDVQVVPWEILVQIDNDYATDVAGLKYSPIG